MFAVIKSGGHQYRVNQGDEITVDKLLGKEGDKVTFDKVMLVGNKVGAPLVSGAKVEGTIKSQFRGEKLHVFKYKRRKNYKRTKSHRQDYTKVTIGKISG